MGSLCLLSYNCMGIYNYDKIKILEKLSQNLNRLIGERVHKEGGLN